MEGEDGRLASDGGGATFEGEAVPPSLDVELEELFSASDMKTGVVEE